METPNKTQITIEATIHAPVEKVWKRWTEPDHITKWNHAADDWHTPRAENDLRSGGKFVYRMEAKDGSFGFDFGGEYTEVVKYKIIANILGDGREMKVTFSSQGNVTKITEIFEAEGENPVEMQKAGWQAILDNFKKYVENN